MANPVLAERMKRYPDSGQLVTFWADSKTQAALRTLAKQRGVTVNKAARMALDECLEYKRKADLLDYYSGKISEAKALDMDAAIEHHL